AFPSGFATFPLVPSAAKRDTAKSDEAQASRRIMRRTTGARRGVPADISDFLNSIIYQLYPLGRYASRTKTPLSFPTQGRGMVEAAGVDLASEDRQRPGSTCVADRLCFAATHAHRQA